MKILAIDSSGMPASVAVCEDGTLLAEYTVDFKRTHSQTLLPMMDEVKRQLELDLSSVDVIAVAAGPGSFTGLRIGSATAKGIGLALDRPLISVPTLEGMAYNFYGSSDIIVPMMDAMRATSRCLPESIPSGWQRLTEAFSRWRARWQSLAEAFNRRRAR